MATALSQQNPSQPPRLPFPAAAFPVDFRVAAANADETTIFVGNLPLQVNSAYLFHMFAQYGPIVACRVSKNVYTHLSRGFGFVQFKLATSAQNAFRERNGHVLFGRELRVMPKKRISELDARANVVVRNLDKSIKTRQLAEHCRDYKSIVSLIVFGGKKDREDALNIGYIQFETQADAQTFISEQNGKMICDRELVVEPYVRAKPQPISETKNLFLKCFPLDWDKERVEAFIRSEVSALGPISNFAAYPSPIGGFYAFAAFESAADARLAIERFNGRQLAESEEAPKLYVGFALRRKVREQIVRKEKEKEVNETNLHVRSVRPDVSVEAFTSAFERFGTLKSVTLRKIDNNPNEILQFGLVKFESSAAAMEVIRVHKTDSELRQLVIPTETREFIGFYQPKWKRQEYLKLCRINLLAKHFQRQSIEMLAKHAAETRGRPPRGHNHRENRGHHPRHVQPLQPPNIQPTLTPAQLQAELVTKLQKAAKQDKNALFACLTENKTAFAALDDQKQREIIGPVVYGCVKELLDKPPAELQSLIGTSIEPSDVDMFCAKITGMLIDPNILDLDDRIDLLIKPALLCSQVGDAVAMILESLTAPTE